MSKWTYNFRQGEADGAASMKELLGGKGAGLAEMARLRKMRRAVAEGYRARIDTEIATLETYIGRKGKRP